MEPADEIGLKKEIVSLIPRLRRFALGLTGGGSEADDIVQIALERALGRLHQFTPGTRLESWLFRIVQTSWIDERRRANRREEAVEMDALERLQGGGSAHHDAAQIRQDVAAAMTSLNDEQRILIVYVLVEGYSYGEAAEALGIPIGTVMSRLARARKLLVEKLSAAEESSL